VVSPIIRFKEAGQMAKNFSCKQCSFSAKGPGTLGKHYKEFPAHKPVYGSAAQRERVVKVRASRVNGAAHDLSIFDELDSLVAKFNRAIHDEESVITGLEAQIVEHRSKLAKLRRGAQILEALTSNPFAAARYTQVRLNETTASGAVPTIVATVTEL
jgi:hypothetical protein